MRTRIQLGLARIGFVFVMSFCSINSFGQEGLGAARLIAIDESVQLTFHRASAIGKLNDKPLSVDEVEKGFKNGEAVGIRYSAPFDSYVYIVNASEWDGVSLQYPSSIAKNNVIPANTVKDFAFILENKTNKATTGREELLVMVTKTKVDNADLSKALNDPSRKIAITPESAKSLPAPPAQPAPAEEKPTKPSKTRTIVTIACRVASVFFPFAKLGCAAAGFGAARYIEAPGDTTIVIMEKEGAALTMRFSFAVAP